MNEAATLYIVRSSVQMREVNWAASECAKQQSGEYSVYRMLCAWQYSKLLSPTKVTPAYIKDLGLLVDPINSKGWRTTPVTIKAIAIPWQNIERSIQTLCDAEDLTPETFYREFELIHPFKDGNGRVGAILWNFLSEKEIPIAPPRLTF